MLLPFLHNKSRVGFAVVCPRVSGGFAKERVCFSLPPGNFPTRRSLGMEDNLGAPGGCGRGRGGGRERPAVKRERAEAGRGGCGRRGKGANFIPTAATRPAAALSFSGARPPPSPLPSSSSRAVVALSPFSSSSSAPPTPNPRAGETAREAKGTPGNRKSGRERAGRKGQKVARSWEGGNKSFWWRRVWSRPRRRLAARASFPFPGSGPRAWRGRDGRGPPPPRAPAGEDRPPLRTALGRPEAPCPGDAETRAAGSARTRLQLKDVSSMQAKHTPWPRGGEAGDFNHLSNVRSGPKTSPPCADLSSLEQTSRLSDVGGRHRFQAHSPST